MPADETGETASETGAEAAPDTPPEFRFKEIVLTEHRSGPPAWMTTLLGVCLGLILVLALGMWMQMEQMRRMARSIRSMQEQMEQIQLAQSATQSQLEQMRNDMGGLSTNLKELSEAEMAFPSSEELDRMYGDDEPPPERTPRVPGGGRTGSILGGWWSGSF